MAKRITITLIPKHGLNLLSDPLIQSVSIPDVNTADIATFDVGGINCEYTSVLNATTTVEGYQKYSGTALTNPYQALYLLDNGSNSDLICLSGGKFYYYDSNKNPVNIDAATPVTFSTSGFLSLIQFGDYAVFGDNSETPYKWSHGDANLTKLIQSGTEYKFKYLETFQQRIFGIYSDQTNGQIEIRWTDALPSWASLSFPSDNQLYKPDNDLGFTGIKRRGNNQCYVYGKDSILSLDYFPNSVREFGLNLQTTEIGTENHWSIVDTGYSHIFYDRFKGFIEYFGGNKYKIISDPIRPLLDTIAYSYQGEIYGISRPRQNEIAYFVPLDNSSTNNAILVYNLDAKEWRREPRSFCLGYKSSLTTSSMTWTDFIATYGTTWPTGYSWASALGRENEFYGASDGNLYTTGGVSEDGSAYDSYRIEPIISLEQPERWLRLQEIRFYDTFSSSENIQVYWRGGLTEHGCLNASWESLGSLNSEYTLYFDKSSPFHQFKWGYFDKKARFSVSVIKIKGIRF